MKVAIVHYHLEPGGVTRVIENTIQAWREDNVAVETVVLSGRKYSGSILERTATVEGLDYANASDCPDPQILAERLEKAALEVLGSSPDVWHFHNHSLGKNPALTSAVSILSKKVILSFFTPMTLQRTGDLETSGTLALITRVPTPSDLVFIMLH